jgi:hypothetical protein
VFLSNPLQDPFGWLVIGGLFAAIFLWLTPYAYRKYVRPYPSVIFGRAGLALWAGAELALCTGLAILVLVVLPSKDALSAWEHSQRVTLDARHCADTAYAALFKTYYRVLAGNIASWQQNAYVVASVGVGPLLIFLLWFAPRLRAQPARQ